MSQEDNLRSLIIDLLIKKKIPFINKKEISGTIIEELFLGVPSLIIRGKVIIDIFSESGTEVIQERKRHYKRFKGLGFDYLVITPYALSSVLPRNIFDPTDIEYLEKQLKNSLQLLTGDDGNKLFESGRNEWVNTMKSFAEITVAFRTNPEI